MAAALILATAFFILPLPGNIPVLMYHFIGSSEAAAENKNVVTRAMLEKQLAFLKWGGYRIISVKEMEQIVKGRQKPRGREVVITFDDGDISFQKEALDLFNRHQFPVTLFLVSDQVENPGIYRMSAETLRGFSRYPWIDLQGHTKTHRVLSEATDEEIEQELVDSKKRLEDLLNRPIDYLAYPTGTIDQRAPLAAEKAGYKMAFVTSYKKIRGMVEGPYTIPREKISRTSENWFQFWVRVSGIYRTFKQLRHLTTQASG